MDPSTEPMERSLLPDPLRDGFEEGIRLFNEGRFFECHEVLEAVWLKENGHAKQFLQGLIQIAVGYHHHSQDNYVGMHNLLQRGHDKVIAYGDRYLGLELRELLAVVRGCIRWADKARDGPEMPSLRTPRLEYRR